MKKSQLNNWNTFVQSRHVPSLRLDFNLYDFILFVIICQEQQSLI